ncbi:hypothetical protein [Methanohalophilus halophilus]|uniref:Uncharacterized protein n=1 Tax=Methanohalophilus halophilus TaxID=2177 RepID=A0A1L3Q354_9EURY|nr:hypothetical protein [Methanohalophilus halophilus]APH39312.1 hypothetical protein BHR79_07340 [Methanohalophilus halophilus]RNI09621.1 hypothetical protein EFE40_02895 [Methanohalophilus halophilus]
MGEDISDPLELARLEECKDCCVMGNIVFYNDSFKRLKSPDLELEMLIQAKPFPEVEKNPCVSEAIVALPSRLSDSYIKSRMGIESNNSMGTFLLGLDLNPDFCVNMGYCGPAELCNLQP